LREQLVSTSLRIELHRGAGPLQLGNEPAYDAAPFPVRGCFDDPAQLPTEFLFFLVQGDFVPPLSSHQRGPQPRRPTTYDRYLARGAGRSQGADPQRLLLAHRWV